ncbi:MAG: hypothetical protein M1828_004476 [Chrysothrix sp. TS-e1954]|nr:MAG: hypothetical protein M1828_004476 [Chrysothrix sp. TS-e1954]
MTTMMQQRPNSPPNNDLHYGFEHLANHNAGSPFLTGVQHGDQELHSNSPFDSPSMMQQSDVSSDSHHFMQLTYNGSQYPELHDTHATGLGIQFPDFETPESGLYHSGAEYYPAQQYDSPGHDDFMNTPQPVSNTTMRRTRSGRPIARSDSPHLDAVKGERNNARVSKSPRAKKAKTGKGITSKTPKLDAPLSVLTKDMESVPVRDMEEWVNRSAELRQKEAEKRNGYVTRPMNSFMLYRSAYAERTKVWCLQNNHQIVSSVSGESWPLESEQVREHYNELARIERDNHQKAHPDYKFSPSKPSNATRRRKDGSSEDDEPSDTEDPDWEWKPKNERRGAKSRRGRHTTYPSYQVPQNGFYANQYDIGHAASHSAWNLQQPTQSQGLPIMIGSHAFPEQVYQQPSTVPVQRQEDLSTMSASYHELFEGGMPSGVPGDTNGSLAQFQSSTDFGSSHLDPSLMQFGDEYVYAVQEGESNSLHDLPSHGTHFEGDGHLFSEDGDGGVPSQFEELMEQQS